MLTRTLSIALLFVSLGAAANLPLFNGKDLSDWKRIPRHEKATADEPFSSDQTPGFRVENGLLISQPEKAADDLWYPAEKFGNVTIRVVYKVSVPEANSGIFIRIPNPPVSEDDAINKGIEVQIDQKDDDFHCTGVLYSMTKAKARPYKPVGEWNTLEIKLEGPRTIVHLNGVLVTDYDGHSPVPPKHKEYEPDRGPRPDFGYVAVQHHAGAGTVTFREITVLR